MPCDAMIIKHYAWSFWCSGVTITKCELTSTRYFLAFKSLQSWVVWCARLLFLLCLIGVKILCASSTLHVHLFEISFRHDA
ncbi:Uncharacterized protein TCM_011300 [Theobroma cacao]|uniref:Uncharacterized protein n=1 Tax=Theobroma cacao TaxID=3641 RepID=A0A061EAG9_THECC|nr:Uncharacterized protein TCM_011300 [Theobroma cacao]